MTTTHPKALLFFACLFLLSTASAQHNFKPGYIVKPEGDTIQGFIDDGSRTHNSSICNFRPATTATAADFMPNELKAYGFANNKHYITKNIQPTGIPVYAFLQYLVKGTINLFYSNNGGMDHYFIEQDNMLYALTNEDVSFVDNGVSYTKKSNRYKGNLAYIMKDVPTILPAIQNTDLDRESLINLVEKYHKNLSKPQAYITYREKKEAVIRERVKLKYGLSLGFNSSKMKMSSAMGEKKSYVFSDGGIPTGSISFDPEMMYSNMPGLPYFPVKQVSATNLIPALFLNISRNGKNSFQVEIDFFRNEYKINDFTIQMDRLLIPIMYRRGLGYHKKIEPFINAGLCMGVNLNIKTDNLFFRYRIPERTGTGYTYTTIEEYITKENTTRSTIGNGLIAGLGFTYDLIKKMALEFEFRTGISGQQLISNFDDHLFVNSKIRYWNNALSVAVSF